MGMLRPAVDAFTLNNSFMTVIQNGNYYYSILQMGKLRLWQRTSLAKQKMAKLGFRGRQSGSESVGLTSTGASQAEKTNVGNNNNSH